MSMMSPQVSGTDIQALLNLLQAVGDPEKSKEMLEQLALAKSEIDGRIAMGQGLQKALDYRRQELEMNQAALDERAAELDKREAAVAAREQMLNSAKEAFEKRRQRIMEVAAEV